jgi:hypothetical protein
VIWNNLIENIGFGEPTLPYDENGDPLYQGDGIDVINFEATPGTVSIARNRIINFNNNGINAIAVVNPDEQTAANLTAHVENNIIIALGPNDVVDQWGIQFWSFGSEDPQLKITGTIVGNQIRDVVTIAPYPFPGIGIIADTVYDVELAANTIENVNIGIGAGPAFSTRILHNRIRGPQWEAERSTGVVLSGSDIWVAENRINKLENGILLLIDVEYFGSALNTALDNNEYDHVKVDVQTGSSLPVLTTDSASANAVGNALPVRTKWQRFSYPFQP